MRVSLIICTRNRAASLGKCLDHVRRLEAPGGDWELIVVDNGSTDATPKLLEDYAASAAFPVVIVREPVPGLSRARNAGIARATGAIVAFTDDDCYVSADFLKEVARVFEDESIGFIGGRILLYDSSDAPLSIRAEREPYRIAPYSFIRAGQLTGANMAFRRSLLQATGPFDLAFGAGALFRSCEETDLQARASAMGTTGAYDPGPLVWHHHGRKPGRDCEALNEGYDYGRGAYFAKFILDARTRRLFLKNWYWWTRSNLRDRQFRLIWWELRGAWRYARFRIWGAKRASDEPATRVGLAQSK